MKCFLFLFTSVILTTYCLAQDKDREREKAKNIAFGADSAVSGDAQLVSHFIVKGLSYSDNNPAMNASFVAKLHPQIKLGIWGSNVSNLNAVDDNFWLKIFSRIYIEFSERLFFSLFITDNRFYKSDIRNGQTFGADVNFRNYEFGLELMSNFEGTRNSAGYLWFGRLYDYRSNLKWGSYAGSTISQSAAYQSYLDFRIVGQYLFNSISNAELGVTFNSNSAQFGIRDDPAIYLALKLYY